MERTRAQWVLRGSEFTPHVLENTFAAVLEILFALERCWCLFISVLCVPKGFGKSIHPEDILGPLA